MKVIWSNFKMRKLKPPAKVPGTRSRSKDAHWWAEWGFYIMHPKLTVEKSLVEMFLQNFFSAIHPPTQTEPHPFWLRTLRLLISLLGTITSLFTEALMPDGIPNPSTLSSFPKNEGLEIPILAAKRLKRYLSPCLPEICRVMYSSCELKKILSPLWK